MREGISSKYVHLLTAVLVMAAMAGHAAAQSPEQSPAKDPTVAELTHKSALMGREMPYRVVVPRNYYDRKNAGRRYPVLILLHGLWGAYSNWTDKSAPGDFLRDGLIIVTPEGGNSWYVDSTGPAGGPYESYLVKELVPEIDSRFRTVSERSHRFVAGLSMGGYGAIKFGLKHPELFSVVGSFSGALDAPLRTQSNPNLNDPIRKVYGDDDSPVRGANDVFRIVREMPDDRRGSLPFIYLDCGTEDWLIGTNREFSKLLIDRKIPHEFRELPGGHAWTLWTVQVQEFMRLVETRLDKLGADAAGRKKK